MVCPVAFTIFPYRILWDSTLEKSPAKSRISETISKDLLPLILTELIPPLPGGVETAAMVDSSLIIIFP